MPLDERNKKRKTAQAPLGDPGALATAPRRRDTARVKVLSLRWSLIGAGIIAIAGALLVIPRPDRSVVAAASNQLARPTGAAPMTAVMTMTNSDTNQPPASTTNVIRVPDPATLEDKAQAINWGTELLARGYVTNAVAFYQRALQLDAEDEEAHFNLAFAYSRQNRPDDAIHHYSEALRVFPDYVEAHNNLGNLLVNRRQFDEAMGHFSTALKLQPENASTLNNLGKCLAVQGKSQEAVQYFSDALRLNADYVEARFNLASALLSLGRATESVAEFETVLRAQPNLQVALQGLAKARQKLAAPPKNP